MSMNINDYTNATHTKAFLGLELLLYIVCGVNAKWLYLGINAKFFFGGGGFMKLQGAWLHILTGLWVQRTLNDGQSLPFS